jgi:hypothetical protein
VGVAVAAACWLLEARPGGARQPCNVVSIVREGQHALNAARCSFSVG